MHRLILIIALAAMGGLAMSRPTSAAEPGPTPSPSSPPSPSATPATPGARITAAIIVRELKALGHTSTVDTDESGDPRVNMAIDGYDWSIYFYECAPGARDDRPCASYQFYSGYTLTSAVAPD